MNNVRVGKIVDLVREFVDPRFGTATTRVRTMSDNELKDAMSGFKERKGHAKFDERLTKINTQINILSTKHYEQMEALKKKHYSEMKKVEVKKDPVYAEALKAGYSSSNPRNNHYHVDREKHNIEDSSNFYISLDKYGEFKSKIDAKYKPFFDKITESRNKVHAMMMNAWTMEDQEEIRTFVVEVNDEKRAMNEILPD